MPQEYYTSHIHLKIEIIMIYILKFCFIAWTPRETAVIIILFSTCHRLEAHTIRDVHFWSLMTPYKRTLPPNVFYLFHLPFWFLFKTIFFGFEYVVEGKVKISSVTLMTKNVWISKIRRLNLNKFRGLISQPICLNFDFY